MWNLCRGTTIISRKPISRDPAITVWLSVSEQLENATSLILASHDLEVKIKRASTIIMVLVFSRLLHRFMSQPPR
jgi:hypothetical protein